MSTNDINKTKILEQRHIKVDVVPQRADSTYVRYGTRLSTAYSVISKFIISSNDFCQIQDFLAILIDGNLLFQRFDWFTRHI